MIAKKIHKFSLSMHHSLFSLKFGYVYIYLFDSWIFLLNQNLMIFFNIVFLGLYIKIYVISRAKLDPTSRSGSVGLHISVVS